MRTYFPYDADHIPVDDDDLIECWEIHTYDYVEQTVTRDWCYQ